MKKLVKMKKRFIEVDVPDKPDRRAFLKCCIGGTVLVVAGTAWKFREEISDLVVGFFTPADFYKYTTQIKDETLCLSLDHYEMGYEIEKVKVSFENKNNFDKDGTRLVHSQAYRGIINELLDPDPDYYNEGNALKDVIEDINKNKVIQRNIRIFAPIRRLGKDEYMEIFKEYLK